MSDVATAISAAQTVPPRRGIAQSPLQRTRGVRAVSASAPPAGLSRKEIIRDQQQAARASARAHAAASSARLPKVQKAEAGGDVPTGELGQSASAPHLTDQLPALSSGRSGHPKSLAPPRRFEPAKMRDAQGRAMLRGVNPKSDIDMYASDTDLFSRRGARTRTAFKVMKSQQTQAQASSTWRAFHSFRASDRNFDDWYADARKGHKFDYQ